MNKPTHMIEHLAFGSVVLLSNGISHGVCPHKQCVPVVRAVKRKKSQVQSHAVPSSTGVSLFNGPGKKKASNATSSSQGEEFEGKKGGTSLEKEQDKGDMTGEQTERQQWLKRSCSSLEVTSHSSAVMAGSSDAGSEEHMFFSTGFPEAQSPCKQGCIPFPSS